MGLPAFLERAAASLGRRKGQAPQPAEEAALTPAFNPNAEHPVRLMAPQGAPAGAVASGAAEAARLASAGVSLVPQQPPAAQIIPNADPGAASPPALGRHQPRPVTDAETAPTGDPVKGPRPRVPRTERPEMGSSGDRDQDLQNYEDDLRGWRNPKGKRSLGNTLEGMGKGALRGLAQGGLLGALGGAVGGGARRLITPNVKEREWRDQEVARVDSEQADRQKERAWEAALRKANADISATEASADWTRKRPEIEGDKLDAMERRLSAQIQSRERIAEGSNETKREVAGMNNETKRDIAGLRDSFLRTKLAEEIKTEQLKEAGRNRRHSEAEAGRNARAAQAEAGRNSRNAAGIASREGIAARKPDVKLTDVLKLAAEQGVPDDKVEEFVRQARQYRNILLDQ